MKKTFRTATGLTGAAVTAALLTLTACGGEADKPAADPSGSDKPAAGAPANMNASGLPIVKEKVTINIAGFKGAVSKDFDTLPFFKETEEKTNIHIKWDMHPGSSWKEKKNLLFASGELPEALYGHYILETDEVVKYGSQGIFIPLEGLIDKYAPNFKKLLDDNPEYKKELTAPDGHIYSLPTIDEGYPDSRDAMFINKKWLDKLNMKIPETTEEFYAALKAFKDNDMNGNGKKDEIPFSFRVHANTGLFSFFGAFGLPDRPDHIVMKGDKVVYSAVQPEYKEAVQYMNRLFKEGLADPESFTHDEKVYYAKIRGQEQTVGAFSAWSINTVFGASAGTDYVPLPPLKGPKGDRSWNRLPVGILSKGSFAITSKNKNPEITMRWIDYMYDPMVSLQAVDGVLGTNIKLRDDGKIEYLPVPSGMNSNEFRHSTAPASTSVFAKTRAIRDKTIQSEASLEKSALDQLYKPYLVKDIYPNVFFTAEENDNRLRYFVDIDAYVNKMYAKWMMQGGLDAEWGEYTKKLNEMGLDKMVGIYQDAYNRYKSVK
ncbi:extracellular solute-binding protein [Paenibacillus flagellatus]|uniref:ABC transporter substrate-binding protein n=1 Tax=Paenibacillus flagellatus TaxID=2211139 RepID=A0A2V5K6I4_9BACL|nr:extracellular solute-binding protein [Paenibacillus flagellatus]PYI54981.1 ABC transporter substrate-binding protein [Paenibacillus flagellatus]